MKCYKKKNDYTVIIFFENRNPVKYTYVHNVDSLLAYVRRKFGIYKAANIYNRRCSFFIKQLKYRDTFR